MTAEQTFKITIAENEKGTNKETALLNELEEQSKKATEKTTMNVLFCDKQHCDKQLIKTKTKDHYWLWHRPRQCDKCSKYLWADDELFTCEKYHFFGSDICVDCSNENKPTEILKKSITLSDDEPKIANKAAASQPETILSPKLCPVSPDNDETVKELVPLWCDSVNFPFCGRKNCDKQLIKTLCKDFYYTFNRWRECEVCRKTMRGNDEMWVCPASHWVNYDLCVDCEQYASAVAIGQKETEPNKKEKKENETVEDVSLV